MKTKKEGRVFDTLGSAASGMGIPKEHIQFAKTHGCQAFKNGRVDETILRAWLADKEDQIKANPNATLRDQKLAEEIRKLRLGNDKKEGSVQNVSALIELLATVLGGALQNLEQKLLNEAPAFLEGLDAPQIRVKLRVFYDQFRANTHELIAKLEAKQ